MEESCPHIIGCDMESPGLLGSADRPQLPEVQPSEVGVHTNLKRKNVFDRCLTAYYRYCKQHQEPHNGGI